ncbi:uncharacterized protein BBA_09541 [Beauveria bassiana ARSEF 2860]|uniref:Uncharacterized protein n=1 Tax=Beauveria bassiana (strain ARSEF 2860) TaxID=655819 RepID=J4UFU9_BEAB2|nr:uncharacterized protein BBA_09541 [Beauveria bassiana ARSEF 2860]EJP61517.1 hypothetical protein BBA_09541 [Beauveria bassiana ARSEF 2860]
MENWHMWLASGPVSSQWLQPVRMDYPASAPRIRSRFRFQNGLLLSGRRPTTRRSIFDCRTLYGRTYQHSETTEHPCLNGERQNTALDIAHHFIKSLLGGRLFEAPIHARLHRILDLGTGT